MTHNLFHELHNYPILSGRQLQSSTQRSTAAGTKDHLHGTDRKLTCPAKFLHFPWPTMPHTLFLNPCCDFNQQPPIPIPQNRHPRSITPPLHGFSRIGNHPVQSATPRDAKLEGTRRERERLRASCAWPFSEIQILCLRGSLGFLKTADTISLSLSNFAFPCTHLKIIKPYQR